MLSFNNLALRRGATLLFEGVSFTIHQDNKIGLAIGITQELSKKINAVDLVKIGFKKQISVSDLIHLFFYPNYVVKVFFVINGRAI